MSFVSDELANVLKSVYRMEEGGENNSDEDSSSKVDKKNEEVLKEKRSRKHKHKKHSKSKSKDKKKHKKRKLKSRSRSRSLSRSRSRTPDEIEIDFVLEKEKNLDTEEKEGEPALQYGTSGSGNVVHSAQTNCDEKPSIQDVHGSKTLDSKEEKLESSMKGITSRNDKSDMILAPFAAKIDVKRICGSNRPRSAAKELKNKKSNSSSGSKSKSPDSELSGNDNERDSRSHSSVRETRRKSSPRSSSKQSANKSRSRSHSRKKSSKKKSRSRSHSRSKTSKKRSRSRSNSKGNHRKRTVSKSRSRSYSYNSRSRSRSPRRRKRSFSRSGRHKRSPSRSRHKSPVLKSLRQFSPPSWKRNVGSLRRQRSRSHSRSGRSPPRRRSSLRRRLSRSRSKGRRSHSRSRTQTPRKRSRSFSRDRRHKRSRSRSSSGGRGQRSTSRDRRRNRSTRSQSKSKEKTQPSNPSSVSNVPVTDKISTLINKPVATDLSAQQTKVAQRAGGKTIAELTAFCKKLQDEKDSVNSGNTSVITLKKEEDSQPVAHHPFLIKEKPDITIPPVIFPVNKPMIPIVGSSKPLQEQFPVSSGNKHREKEDVSDGAEMVTNTDGTAIQTQPKVEVFPQPSDEKLDISYLVAKRMDAQRRLQTDPNDIEALLVLQEIQMKMQNWCQSNVKPGQFTGELVKNLLPKEDLQGGFQAWAKKDMFHNLTPVSGGIGMKLLQKMGWKPGQVIGKRGEGYAEPIALTVKIDRKGLSAGKEKATKKSAPTVLDLQVKGINPFEMKPAYKQFNLQCLLIRC
ncbi:protein SON-like isoform X3 [Stylophora pistillata]|uniref:protein SON-like isoform X3 n=1 Tax=Stylophora pistillata TaxID=50429 RepID=UPI000C040237|nr:protein SON-like isoform X3 [Stylophora pistillata]